MQLVISHSKSDKLIIPSYKTEIWTSEVALYNRFDAGKKQNAKKVYVMVLIDALRLKVNL